MSCTGADIGHEPDEETGRAPTESRWFNHVWDSVATKKSSSREQRDLCSLPTCSREAAMQLDRVLDTRWLALTAHRHYHRQYHRYQMDSNLMSEVDRLLEVLDGGLQRSPEASYGQDHDQSLCARCRRYPHVVDGDLCALCRVFLLGDSDEDPTKPSMTVPIPVDASILTDLRVYAQLRARVDAEFRSALVEAFHQFARRG